MAVICVITGENLTGKTSLCLKVIELAREKGVRLGGVVSPGVFHQGEKIAIDLLDVRTNQRTRLADDIRGGKTEISTQRWAFRSDAIQRGNQILKQAVPCELLVIDELGPLEFQQGEGWVSGIETVTSGDYVAALLVIRPSLVDEALNRWDVDQIIDLDDQGQPRISAEMILQSLFPTR